MKRLFTAVCITLLFGWSAEAVPARVSFHGNRAFSSGELNQYLGLPEGRVPSSDSLDARIIALRDSLVAHDFMFAGVDSFRASQDRKRRPTLNVYVHEGHLAQVSTVQWLGDSVRVPHSVAARATVRPGSTFRWSNIEFDSNLLLDHFENAGYPFAEVEISSVEPDSARETVAVTLLIRSGPPTSVDFVSFPGTKVTRPDFLQRESRLRFGEAYSQKRVESARRRLRRLDFLRSVGDGEIAVNESGQTGVRFPIQESRSTRLDIAAGYLPANAGRPATVSGLANLEFLNLFGGGRRALIHWERPDSRIQSAEVAYREPWVFNLPLALQFNFAQRIQDTLYVTRKFGLRADVDLGSNVNSWGSISQDAVIADSASSAALGIPDNQTISLESGFSFDTRDHPTNPRSGVYFSTQAGTGWRQRDNSASNLPAGSFRLHRAGIDAEIAEEFVPFWIADAAVHARALETSEPEVLLPDLYRLGGARTLRGYREEQFLGSRVGWASLELRYWLGPASRFFIFGDAGSIYRQQHVLGALITTTLFRPAAGLGLRLETDLGVWGIDYGIGQGDRFLTGKLHISLLSSF
jgi:outer membrane protein assembly factor BamA